MDSLTFVDATGGTKKLVRTSSGTMDCYDGETLKVTAVDRIVEMGSMGVSISGKKPGDESGRPMSLMSMMDAAEGAKVVAFFEGTSVGGVPTSGADGNDSDGSESSGEIDDGENWMPPDPCMCTKADIEWGGPRAKRIDFPDGGSEDIYLCNTCGKLAPNQDGNGLALELGPPARRATQSHCMPMATAKTRARDPASEIELGSDDN